MESSVFLIPKFTGKRFEDHSIPLECLKDLSVLEWMITSTAKSLYLKANTGRTRSPKGFLKGVSLQLQGVQEGSAKAVIALVIYGVMQTTFIPGNLDYLNEAKAKLIEAMSIVEKNGDVRKIAPEIPISGFQVLGRSLRDDEAIDFGLDSAGRVTVLTKDTRRKLLATTRDKSYTEAVTLYGYVTEADKDRKSFQVRLLNGSHVFVPDLSVAEKNVLEAFSNDNRVRLNGIGSYSFDNSLQSINSVESVDILDTLDVGMRIEELKLLKDGWYDEDSKSPKAEDLIWFSSAFEEHYLETASLPYIYSTYEGGIQLEWHLGRNSITLEIDFQSKSAIMHTINLDAGIDSGTEVNLDLTKDESWELLNQNLIQHGVIR